MAHDLSIRVTRDVFLKNATLSRVELDLPGDGKGFLPFGYCLEDTDRHVEEDPKRKQSGVTAIPTGTYGIKLYNSPKHGADTPELVDVPGYQHVQIHSGNTPEDTLGCLLFGLDRDVDDAKVLRSRQACTWIRASIIDAIKAGGNVTVTVRRKAG